MTPPLHTVSMNVLPSTPGRDRISLENNEAASPNILQSL
jgi:hypothetical protein